MNCEGDNGKQLVSLPEKFCTLCALNHERSYMENQRCFALALLSIALVGGCASTVPQERTPTALQSDANKRLLAEARVAAQAANSPLSQAFYREIVALPSVAPRTVYYQKNAPRATRQWYSAANWAKLNAEQQAQTQAQVFDETGYYATFYGSPMAYALVLDVAYAHGIEAVSGKRIVDYGYGAIGTIRLLAQAGARVTGIDVDPMLVALYDQPGDVGVMKGTETTGDLRIVNANFPSELAVTSVGNNNDLIISKNTLKKGYVAPDQGKAQIDPGVPLPQFLKAMRDALKPGGLLVIYNISQKLDPGNYRPANDPRSPFTKAQYEFAGFEVLAFDASDDTRARKLGESLGWGGPQGMGDLQTNLFALYTVVKRIN
jgi:SAM-dependent methyltransferase